MVELIIATWKFHLPDEPTILGGTRIEINDTHSVVLTTLASVE
jgi:hypothetical protein